MLNHRERTLRSLRGLTIGDAFGETFFVGSTILSDRLENRTLAPPPWSYTDDTEMALSIVDVLFRKGSLDQDELVHGFVSRYTQTRDYGGGAQELLARLAGGGDWRKEAPIMFGGTGSYGNGAAMRIAPLGAFFADDLDALCENASLSAQTTHAHPEGIAGAVAVAVAAGLAWKLRENRASVSSEVYLHQIAERVPASETRDLISEAAEHSFHEQLASFPSGKSIDIRPAQVASELGSGLRVSAQDTVPYCLWCAARHWDNYEEALWATASALGDVDTTCAIVGGIVALSAPLESIPKEWSEACEPLPLEFRSE